MDRKLLSRRQAFGIFGAAGATSLFGTRLFADDPKKIEAPTADFSKLLPLQGSGFYKFKLGSFDLALVSDGGFVGEPKQLFPKVEPEDIESAARASFVSSANIPMHVNTLLIRTGKENILIDTGCGANFGESAGKLKQNLTNCGVDPGAISSVVVTHAHPDHFGGLEVFPKARVVTSKSEHDFWTGSADLNTSLAPEEMRKGITQAAKGFFDSVKDRLDLIEGEKEIASGITLLPSPGHTAGHCAVLINSGSDQLLYLTDAMHVQSIQLMHPEFQIMFDADPKLAEQTRRKLLDRAASDRVMVSGSHLSFPALGHIKARGNGYEFVPRIWQW